MNPAVGLVAFLAVSITTAVIGFYGLRISRTTGDFYVASRTVPPWWNASAIGGEYLSAASFLGVAGLILLSGTDALWFPVGYTAGYLMLLLFVAAPLRRSGAYTIPDFTEARLDSRMVRRVTSLVVVAVGWLYIVPQLHGAALTIRITTGLPSWVGSTAVVLVVCLTVVAGGMRSITFVQAFQYWLKLTALAVPVIFVLLVLAGNGTSQQAQLPVNPTGQPAASAYQNISLMVALLFGTLGLPHVLVRFYTNPDGQSARRTTLIVLGLLSVFYLFPTLSGAVGRIFARNLHSPDKPMRWSCCCPASSWEEQQVNSSQRLWSPAPSPRSSPPRPGWWFRSRASSARTSSEEASGDSASQRCLPPSCPWVLPS